MRRYVEGLRGKAASTSLTQTDALHTRYAAASKAADPSAALLLLTSARKGSGAAADKDKPAKVAGRAEKLLKVLRKICDAQASKLRVQDKKDESSESNGKSKEKENKGKRR